VSQDSHSNLFLSIYLFVSGNKAHKHHKHEQKKTDRNTDNHETATEQF